MLNFIRTSMLMMAVASLVACDKSVNGQENPVPGTEEQVPESTTLNVLGIGNSWTRDAFRYIYGIAESAGVKPVIAHAYLGGSTLEDQFYGIDDLSYSYSHNGQQVVHSTYQYWLYDGSADPVKTPKESLYENGSLGNGVTLEYILNAKAWDVIVFQPSSTFLSEMDKYMGTGSKDESRFSMARFVAKVKKLLPAEVASKVRFALMVPWSYPSGCSCHYSFMYTWNGGTAPSDQDGWDRVFDDYNAGLQDGAKTLSGALGETCTYYVNVGRAIYHGRQDETLVQCGYKLQREQDNTHLSEGVSKYLASLMFAYEIFGLKPEQITFCPDTYDFTQQRAAAAREVAWNAWRKDVSAEVDSVSTSAPVKNDDGSALLKGSFRGKYQNSAKDFTCGFEYKADDGAWTALDVAAPFYEFSATLSGIDTSKTYTVRAWAASSAGKKYGNEQTLRKGAARKLTLAPSVNDFKSQGLPSYNAYPVTGADPGQEPFTDKEFIYTHPETKQTYSFIFYGKGPQLFSKNAYYVYFAYSGSYFLFGKEGSYIKLPAVPGMRLEKVTLTCDHSSGKGWGIAATKEGIATKTTVAGGEVYQFLKEPYTFTLTDTAPDTGYYLFLTDNPSKMQMTSVVYTD